jgi:thiol-disulfide isomerase/thioredoxin
MRFLNENPYNKQQIIVFFSLIIFYLNNFQVNSTVIVSYNKTEDFIEVLSVDTFDAWVYNSETTSIVEFFAHWCGRCKRWAVRNYQ